MRKVNSEEDEFEEVGFDYRASSVKEVKKDGSGWIVVVVIVVSILFAYYFFDQTYSVKTDHKEGIAVAQN